ncbi:hypothetical protein BPP43_01865 [Brachyspira pilosicoli P43/6/78]|uniref:Uncharacterized protein n=1 Tax=Brachyspira pilosicoli P43/6/78 TaxID=1042417 RepID=A0A3B6VKM4_BRAPL|nr:hypothetical protein BPP43_01865 [Brachyspira pilosicoli P43/6/78]
MVILSFSKTAILFSSINTYLFVYFSIAGTSEAKKFSLSPKATIKGADFLTAYTLLTSSLNIIAKA